MKRAKSFIYRRIGVLGIGALIVALHGCNPGSEAPSKTPSSVFSGVVTLPAGESPANVVVLSGLDEEPLVKGTFTVEALSGFPTLITAFDSEAGQVVLLGMLDPSATTQTLDASSSAAALLFESVGGSQEPSDGRATLLASVLASSATATLASAIQTAMDADRFALQDGAAAIQAALATAVSDFTSSGANGEAASNLPAVTNAAGSPISHDLGEGETYPSFFTIASFTSMETCPSRVTSDSVPVSFRGIYPWEVQFSVFYTGSADATLVTPQSLESLVVLPPGGKVIVNIPSHPDGGNASFEGYTFVTLDPIFDSPDPDFVGATQYSQYVPGWRAVVADMWARAQVQVVATYLLEALGWGGALTDVNQLQQCVADFRQLGPSAQALLQTARTGTRLNDSSVSFLLDATASDSAAQAYIGALHDAFGVDIGVSPNRITNLRGTALLFEQFGVYFFSNSIGSLTARLNYHVVPDGDRPPITWANEEWGNWFYPTIAISPASASISPGGEMAFTATPRVPTINNTGHYGSDPEPPSVMVEWTEDSSAGGTLSGGGTIGNLLDMVSGPVGPNSSLSMGVTASYDSTLLDKAPVTITVRGFVQYNDGAPSPPFGSATATVSFGMCGAAPLATGNICCADLTQGPTCCGSTALALGNLCCTDDTQGASCCGTTALHAGNLCCTDGTQGANCCGSTACLSNPRWASGPDPFRLTAQPTSGYGLGLNISEVSPGVLSIVAIFVSGNSAFGATYSGNSAVSTDGNNIQMTLDPSATPPTIYVYQANDCLSGTLTHK